MIARAYFRRDERGVTAVEFALILPIFLLFLLGLIDVGRYAWSVNQAEKATQIGARWAVATDMVATGLYNYSFAVNGDVPQGDLIGPGEFDYVTCQDSGGAVACSCQGASVCNASWVSPVNQAAFDRIVARMRQIYPPIAPANVIVDYQYSGLGFSGDPNGSDVAPLVNVRLQNMSFPLYFMLGTRVPLPSFSYSLTLEDGEGSVSN